MRLIDTPLILSCFVSFSKFSLPAKKNFPLLERKRDYKTIHLLK